MKIYLTGSKALIGYVSYHVVSGKPKTYTVVKRRRVVKVYALKEGGRCIMKYLLIKGMLSKVDMSSFNCGAERFGLSATADVLEVDYSEGENNGLCIRYVVFVGGSFTPSGYVRDVGEFYKICTHTNCTL